MPKKNYPVLGLFAGVGGIEFGFKKAGFDIAAANEIDSFAAQTYVLNHSHPLILGSISHLDEDSLNAVVDVKSIKVVTGGFPCQPFSVAGFRKGFDDDRGNLFWEIHRLIRLIEPEVIFLENVKNLKNHDEGRTFETIKGALEGTIPDPAGTYISPGYHVVERVFNASQFGIPQNRERIFIVAFKSEDAAKKFAWPDGTATIEGIDPLAKYIDFEGTVAQKYYYSESQIFEALNAQIEREDTVYQWRRHYVRENKSGMCPTLTANMGMGGHNVPIVKTKTGIRKLTPRECFALMGMPGLALPEKMVDSRLYKQAGNAVVVPVIEAIAKEIMRALD